MHADDDRGDDAKGAAAAAAERPVEVLVFHRGHGDELTIGCDDFKGEDVIRGHAVEAGERSVAAPGNVAPGISDALFSVSHAMVRMAVMGSIPRKYRPERSPRSYPLSRTPLAPSHPRQPS